ncbi:cell wall hydrolase [Limimaricola sp. G21655-S1]|uniref:cell wall hydrolase n=1 Tax=Limimaricola sp. G21655-S1 TaxID=3014768 RepID=UPI0022AEB8F8|nr:cell wall hydrolase [Limimaricola sp. G21655-S1]MCZ4260510.1 cell wall hydrolase [Limimaricola sp. G21655-S1]
MKQLNFLRLPMFGAMACLATVVAAAPASAGEDGLVAAQKADIRVAAAPAADTRLSLLLGDQRDAGQIVPAVADGDALPAAADRGLKTDISNGKQDYDVLLASQPSAKGDAQWECLTEALYFEARGESVKGQFAVAEVILNRVDSPDYPDTICKVVNQGTGRKYACQFSYTCDGIPDTVNDQRSWNKLGRIAEIMIEDGPRELTAGATHYHTTAVNPSWAGRIPRTAAIGAHLFYREATRTASN